MGTTKHFDNSFLTILLQDQIGGLEVLHQDQWVDVPPMSGALVNLETIVRDYVLYYYSKGLDGTSVLPYFKLKIGYHM
ncbi:1-aminocyclopropane-1-carboxylate oxidase-like 10 [Vitis vinifera]|uniref:1-aminocyclopropane-1-carboxylate oxidase-like 10 n=1 Tax=Vitis vinifera TaxID=29760 RepID=A0A438CE99_VITVI|nr:1-aminocyclopropane-1-carboxylate oxidase-like 10 [Vitis vinifera]